MSKPKAAKAEQSIGSSGKYIWVNEFNDASFRDFYEKFTELERDEETPIIMILISSYGGEVNVLTAMRDLIKSSDKPVSTIATGKAMSAGAALLAAGTPGLRCASRHTDIMIHEMSSGLYGKAEDIKNDAAAIQRSNQRLLKALADDMGVPLQKLKEELAKRKNTDWYLSSKEAKAWGLIDYVTMPRILTQGAKNMMLFPEVLMAQSKPAKKKPGKK